MLKLLRYRTGLMAVFILLVSAGCSAGASPARQANNASATPRPATKPTAGTTETVAAVDAPPAPEYFPTLEATPDIPLPVFAGFPHVEQLPNNVFVAQQPLPNNASVSLMTGGGGGGQPYHCGSTDALVRIFPGSIDYGIGGPGVLEFCNFPYEEDLRLDLKQPDGTALKFTLPTYAGYAKYCLPGTAVLQDGEYEITATTESGASASFTFTLDPPTELRLYFPQSAIRNQVDQYYCVGQMVAGQSAAIYLRGLPPKETVQILLYHNNQYQTTWQASADENGNDVQYIEKPEFDFSNFSSAYQVRLYTGQVNPNGLPDEGDGLGFLAVDPSVPSPTPAADYEAAWVKIPAGDFEMGAYPGDPMAEDTEKPRHKVSLTDYWIQDNEVTNANYARCVDAGSCTIPAPTSSHTHKHYFGDQKFADYPVINVTYKQAGEYCEWLGGSLPSEAEWEKAARYPDNGIYPWNVYGNDAPTTDLANFGHNWPDVISVVAFSNSLVSDIHNLAGNVWEWIKDWYAAYPGGSPGADAHFGKKFRVLRGGSYGSAPGFLRISNRFYQAPDKPSDSVGFRCARTSTP